MRVLFWDIVKFLSERRNFRVFLKLFFRMRYLKLLSIISEWLLFKYFFIILIRILIFVGEMVMMLLDI